MDTEKTPSKSKLTDASMMKQAALLRDNYDYRIKRLDQGYEILDSNGVDRTAEFRANWVESRDKMNKLLETLRAG